MKFFNKKSLIVLCIFLTTVFVIYASFNKKSSKKDIEFPTEILKDYIDTINDIDINFKLDDGFNSKYVSRIIEARLTCEDNIAVVDAIELQKKICKYSNKYNLTQEEGFIIVHIESDFKTTAYNKYGNAIGLCQITQPCVREYNNMHGTSYTLEQMYNVDLNLEVGFWYFNRLLNHYSKYSEYGITTDTRQQALRDCYIAYNIGITKFKEIGRYGRNQLRIGYYPVNMYGAKKGDAYEPIYRYRNIYNSWS
jgi:soluble lytic murein transglycosylase-like protein